MATSSKTAKRERQRQNRAARLEYEAALARRRRFWRSVRGFLVVLVPVLAIFVILMVNRGDDAADGDGAKKPSPSSTVSTAAPRGPLAAPDGVSIDVAKTYTATLETSEGTIVIALDAANAPVSVNNFVYLAREGFYDGLLFNRAARDFVIQTGSPSNTTVGDPGYSVQGELPASYEVGSVAWAKGGAEPPGTAGSQFFIGTGPNITSLPPEYGHIGTVTEGLDVAQRIMGYAPASGDGKPTTDVTIRTVTITES